MPGQDNPDYMFAPPEASKLQRVIEKLPTRPFTRDFQSMPVTQLATLREGIEQLQREAELNNVYKVMVETLITLTNRLSAVYRIGFLERWEGFESPHGMKFLIYAHNTQSLSTHAYTIMGHWRREEIWDEYMNTIAQQIKVDTSQHEPGRMTIMDSKPETPDAAAQA